MQANFILVFSLNGNFVGNMLVNENVLFYDVARSFNCYNPLKSEDEKVFSILNLT